MSILVRAAIVFLCLLHSSSRSATATGASQRVRRQTLEDYYLAAWFRQSGAGSSTDAPQDTPGGAEDPGNPEGRSFDFGGDTDWDNGEDAPRVGSVLEPPDLNDSADNSEKEEANVSSCDPNYCELFEPCMHSEICTVSPNCDYFCIPKDANETTTTSKSTELPVSSRQEDTPGLRPLSERRCAQISDFECVHGYCQDLSCICDDGWDGFLCTDPCGLTCENEGVCKNIQGTVFCNCLHDYEGERCERLKPDPEEKARVLAASLSSALAVVFVLLIIVPIILWRMRVIFVLKLVYFFKEYEDDDGKLYDAYVSMTPTATAEKFVYGSLRPKLENLGFKLYLQARDCPAGEAVSETILNALEKSRRTIMIVTLDYVNNEWNRFEYLIAQQETLKLRQRIIPVILEDVKQEDIKLEKSLKHILDSIKCLQFPQSKSTSSDTSRTEASSKETEKLEQKEDKFWKRLELTMPKKKKQPKSDKNPTNNKNSSERAAEVESKTKTTDYQEVNISDLDKKLSDKNYDYIDLGTAGVFKKEQTLNLNNNQINIGSWTTDSSQVILELDV